MVCIYIGHHFKGHSLPSRKYGVNKQLMEDVIEMLGRRLNDPLNCSYSII